MEMKREGGSTVPGPWEMGAAGGPGGASRWIGSLVQMPHRWDWEPTGVSMTHVDGVTSRGAGGVGIRLGGWVGAVRCHWVLFLERGPPPPHPHSEFLAWMESGCSPGK